MIITLPDVLRVAVGATRNKVAKWRLSGYLQNALPEGSAGTATPISRSAALEIAFIAALTSRGYQPYEAAYEAARWIAEENERGRLRRYWVGDPQFRDQTFGGEIKLGFCFDKDFTTAELMRRTAKTPGGWGERKPGNDKRKPATGIVVINRAEIVRRIDEILDTP